MNETHRISVQDDRCTGVSMLLCSSLEGGLWVFFKVSV